MDDYVRNLLMSWNLKDFIENFENEGIDEESFLLLDDGTISLLIPKAGPRLKFQKYFQSLLASLKPHDEPQKPDEIGSKPTTITQVPEGEASSSKDVTHQFETQDYVVIAEYNIENNQILTETCQEIPPKSAKDKKLNMNQVPLPEFSRVLRPILDGDVISQKDHSTLSSILKEELIAYLNRENLICEGNSITRRWGYRDLGESLVAKYPRMLWDLPSNRQKKKSDKAPIYSVFIRRLSQRRKMQNLRQKKKLANLEADEVPECVAPPSLEDALSELKSVTLEAAMNGTNNDRIKELLRITYEERVKEDWSALPSILMAQTFLETEVELRLGDTVAVFEVKLNQALEKMAAVYKVPGTLLEMEKLMQPKTASWNAITMADYSVDQKRPGPSLFYGSTTKTIVTGEQVIPLEELCSLERSIILLLGLYYILNLNFPAAYGQFLGLLQNLLIHGKKFPRQFSSQHLLMVSKNLSM